MEDRLIALSGQNNPSHTETINVYGSVSDKPGYQTSWWAEIKEIRTHPRGSDRYRPVTRSPYLKYILSKSVTLSGERERKRDSTETEGRKRHKHRQYFPPACHCNPAFLCNLWNETFIVIYIFCYHCFFSNSWKTPILQEGGFNATWVSQKGSANERGGDITIHRGGRNS